MPAGLDAEDRRPRILVLTARPEEFQVVVNGLDDLEEKLHQNHPYFRWTTPRVEVRITHTGVGRQNVRDTLATLQGVLQPDLVLVAGTAGSLREDLGTGSLFIPTAVSHTASEEWLYPSTELLDWMREAAALPRQNEPVRTGPQLTADEGIIAGEERRRLAEEHGAMAVDMETYHVVRRWVPLEDGEETTTLWAGLRVISDELNHDDPDEVLARQEPACERLGEHLLRFFEALEAPETWESG